MRNRKGFMIPMAFILVVAMVVIVGSITIITTTGIRNISQRVEDEKALYIAEAGMNKAIWYLTNPPEEGGMGIDWRTSGVTEEFGGGSYTISIEDDPNGILVSVDSSYKGVTRSLAILADEDFASAFSDYALLSDKNMSLAEGSAVEGGVVAVTEGNEFTGAGVTGDEMTVLETPTIDTTYYDNQVAVTEGGGGSVVQGDQAYTNLDLNGSSLYVNGNIALGGNITGGGDIVSSGNIDVGSTATVGEKTKLIAKNQLTVQQNAQIKKDAVLYGGEAIQINNQVINSDPVIITTPKNLTIGSDASLAGKFYGGQLTIGSNTTIQGSVVGGSYGTENVIENSSKVIYTKFEQDVPPGFEKKVKFKKWVQR